MFSEIYKFKDCKTRRASSFDRTGGNQDFIKFIPGETKTIAEIKGAGIIKHIWITISCTDPMFRRNIIIRMYWDLIDGEAWPGSLHGTGTEDFFNGSWCPSEIYQHPYFGYARVSNKLGWMGRTHCYRYFIQDPIYFTKSLHASIEHGHANTLTLDIATVAYWYQTEYKVFPAMPAKDKRQNMPEIWVTDIHRWACMERVDGCRKTVGK